MEPLFLVLSGPTCSGKNTLCTQLVMADLGFKIVVSATTREPRTAEFNGRDYHFLSPQEFRYRRLCDEFLEWAYVHGTNEDNMYGTPRFSVLPMLNQGQSLIMDVDVQGAQKIREAAESEPVLKRSLHTIFINVGEQDILQRMTERGTPSQDEISRRLRSAKDERRHAGEYEFLINSRSKQRDFEALLQIIDRIRQPDVAQSA